MPSLVPSNDRLKKTCEQYRDQINANLSLRLFTSDSDPQPQTPLSELFEADYPGYVRLPTVGTAGDPVKVTDGIYAITAGPYQWTPTGDSIDRVFGWMMCYGNVLWWAGRFPAPVTVSDGVPIDLTVQIQEGSLSLCAGSA